MAAVFAVIAAGAAVYAVLNYRQIKRVFVKPAAGVAELAAFILPAAVFTAVPAARHYAFYAAPFMWAAAAAAAAYALNAADNTPHAHSALDIALGTACVASFLMTGGKFTPLLLAGSMVILLALSAGIYAKIDEKTALGGLLFAVWSVAVADLVIFGGLSFWARLACAALWAGYICHARPGGYDLGLAEKALPVFLVQCFLVALMKNPLAGM